MHRLKTDPARFEVVKNALTCAAEEMKIVLAKTAYSPLLKVAGDRLSSPGQSWFHCAAQVSAF